MRFLTHLQFSFFAGILLWGVASGIIFEHSCSAAGNDAEVSTENCSVLPKGFQLRQFNDESGSHNYALYLPADYSPDKKWPVVLFLHGAGEKGTDGLLPLSGTLAVALEQWHDAPFIAVFPQCEDVTGRSLTGWLATSSDGQRAMKILDQVEKEYSVDSKKRILAGWSMGGYGAWSQAAANPEHWSAVLTISGGAIPGTVDLSKLAAAKVPVWAIHGKNDSLVSFQLSQDLIEKLNAAGGNGTYTLLDPAGHNICPRVFAQRELFDWLVNPTPGKAQNISFDKAQPLPTRTAFYRQCKLHEQLIPRALSLRLGNDALSELSAGLPEMIPADALRGSLPDIHQQAGRAEDPWSVKLSGLSYHANVTQFRLQAISGGRLSIEIEVQPLALNIARTRLESRHHFADAGPIQIEVGIHKPAILKLEVQPQMHPEGLRLVPLRRSFQFDDGNWYITPPAEIEVRSPTYTKDQLTTGIIGSLYESRKLLEEQVLSAVPRLLKSVESEFDFQPAPALAQALSPVPSLVPDIEVGPSAVSTDANGISLLLDLKALSRSPSVPASIESLSTLTKQSNGNKFLFDLNLDAIRQLTEVTVQQNTTQVNVLDISDDKFAALADPKRMHEVLPDLPIEPAGDLRTMLRLLSPLELTVQNTTADSRKIDLLLSAERVSLDIYDPRAGETPVPVGRIVFRMSQPMSLMVGQAETKMGDSKGADSITVQWLDHCEVKFLSVESLAGSPVPRIEHDAFIQRFREAWMSWAAEHGTRKMSTEVVRLKSTKIDLKSIEAIEGNLQFLLNAASVNSGTQSGK